jgi:acyl-CoA reductase-like NAD-dependent aldehyde dehydrogenase
MAGVESNPNGRFQAMAATLSIDNVTTSAPHIGLDLQEIGGEKNSGLGRFNSDWIIDEFTRTHWITLQHQPRPYPVYTERLK